MDTQTRKKAVTAPADASATSQKPGREEWRQKAIAQIVADLLASPPVVIVDPIGAMLERISMSNNQALQKFIEKHYPALAQEPQESRTSQRDLVQKNLMDSSLFVPRVRNRIPPWLFRKEDPVDEEEWDWYGEPYGDEIDSDVEEEPGETLADASATNRKPDSEEGLRTAQDQLVATFLALPPGVFLLPAGAVGETISKEEPDDSRADD